MKKKSIKKRLAAFGLGLMLSLSVISPFYVHASTSGTQITNYGSYGFGQTYLFDNTRVQTLFTYSFDGVYNGRFRINYSSGSFTGSDFVIPYNCEIETRTSTYIQISFKDQQEIMLIFQNAPANPIDITGVSDYDMTRYGDGVVEYLYTFRTILTSVQNHLATVDNNCNSINSNASLINTSVDNIESDIDTMNANVTAIKNQLRSYFTNAGGTTVTIGDINVSLNYIDSLLDTQLVVQAGIETKLADVLTAINNIDNKIDTITWKTIVNGNNLKYSSDGISNYSNTTGNVPANYYFNVGDFNVNAYTSNYKNLYQTSLSYGNFSRMLKEDDLEFYCLRTNNNNLQRFYPDDVYIQYNRINFMIYFSIHDESFVGGTPWGNDGQLVIKIKLPGYLYSKNAFIKYINSEDIEYWKLLNSIKTFNQYVKDNNYYSNTSTQLTNILNAINSLDLSVNIDQQTQQEINEYNNTLNNIDITIDAELNPLRNNSQQILDSVSNFPTIIMTPADRFYDFMKFVVFQSQYGLNLNVFISKFLKFLLFAILVGVMLG